MNLVMVVLPCELRRRCMLKKCFFKSLKFLMSVVSLSFPNLIIIGIYLRSGVDVLSFVTFCQNFINTFDDLLNKLPFIFLSSLVIFSVRAFISIVSFVCCLSLYNIVLCPTRNASHLDQIFVDVCICNLYDPENLYRYL